MDSHRWSPFGTGFVIQHHFLTVHWGCAAWQRWRFSSGGGYQSPTDSLGQGMEISSLLSPTDTTLGRGTKTPSVLLDGEWKTSFPPGHAKTIQRGWIASVYIWQAEWALEGGWNVCAYWKSIAWLCLTHSLLSRICRHCKETQGSQNHRLSPSFYLSESYYAC